MDQERMMYVLKRALQCLWSPRLYKTYGDSSTGNLYEPNRAENAGNLVMSLAGICCSVAYYMSPFIGIYLFKQGLLSFEEIGTLLKFFTGVNSIILTAVLVRAYGRLHNPQYLEFLVALNKPKDNIQDYWSHVKRFDFDFNAWPATYVIPPNASLPSRPCIRPFAFVSKENALLPLYQKCIVKLLAYIALHTFALRLIYPGSLKLIHFSLWNELVQGRAMLVKENNGQRVKVVTADGNSIDTMFVDHRQTSHRNGKTLVICCEGNTGFYEVGIPHTPLKSGYSVLGWNHPGFAGSTGMPYPRQEHYAIDAVMQYAIQSLKFEPNQIVMYGWSIGGYTAAWAACNYDTKALMLDATFDDLVPLAVNHMPAAWKPLVVEVIRSHVDLNVAEMCKRYRGPLHLIRRTEDEIICLKQGDISTNRGNFLLLKVIGHRHPEVEKAMEDLIHFTLMHEEHRPKLTDPMLDANMRVMLRYIEKYSTDLKLTHCTPLPAHKFEETLNYVLDCQKYLRR